VTLGNRSTRPVRLSLYATLRALGPAGWPVRRLAVADPGDALLADGHPALVANVRPSAAGAAPGDTLGGLARKGAIPGARSASSPDGEASGALRFDLDLPPGATRTLGFIAPVLPGRRAVGHAWDGRGPEVQRDLNTPNPATGGALQRDAGLRNAALLAAAGGDAAAARRWRALAETLLRRYDARFGNDLAAGYGSYSVLWPCRLYPLKSGKAHDRFAAIPPRPPSEWRYFALATAHQALLAGNRNTAARTLQRHFDQDQMRGWYAFDEGGESAPGNWPKLRTAWTPTVAMPHAWSLAELWLLMRDSLVHEDGDRLVLFAGVPRKWLTRPLRLENLPTAFGPLTLAWDGANLHLEGGARPPGGFVFNTP